MTSITPATTDPDFHPWRAPLEQCVTQLRTELKAVRDDIERGAADQRLCQVLLSDADEHLRVSDSLAAELLDLLRRSDPGSAAQHYGRCSQCGQRISAARLHILPTATLCLACVRA